MNAKSLIRSVGSYLPSNIVKNQDLEKLIDTSDEWIVTRTGIKQRQLVAEGEFTSHLATKAAQNALKNASMEANEIDVIIVATTTPDNSFPATAVKVQAALKMTRGAAFDIQAVCSGFVYALNVADSMIKSGSAKNILVIGAESMSKLLDWQDRSTCILFGDGAGAVILSATQDKSRGIIDSQIYSDGTLDSILLTDGGVSSSQTTGHIKMLGKEVYKHAIEKMSNAITQILDKNNFTIDDVSLLIPHQANVRIIESIATRLSFPQSKVIITVDQHANTSAASIPLAMDFAYSNNKLKENDLVVTVAMGGGVTWGAALIRW